MCAKRNLKRTSDHHSLDWQYVHYVFIYKSELSACLDHVGLVVVAAPIPASPHILDIRNSQNIFFVWKNIKIYVAEKKIAIWMT